MVKPAVVLAHRSRVSRDLAHTSLAQVSLGETVGAAISEFGELFWWGATVTAGAVPSLKLPKTKFVAVSCGLNHTLALTADGATYDEALANLKDKLQTRLRHGAVVVPLELSSDPHPLAEFAGMFKDDPLLKGWKKSMKAYRMRQG